MSVFHRPRHLLAHAVRVGRFGDGPFQQSRTAAWYLLLPLKKRMPGLNRRTVTLQLRIGHEPRRLAFSDRSELIAFEEIFCDGEYSWAVRQPPRVIIDGGANIGASVLWFRAQYPSARIIALEPDPRTFIKLAHTLSGVANIELVPWALAAEDGTVTVVQRDRSWGSHVVAGAGPGPRVRGITLGELMREKGLDAVDLLKLDIEGAEWGVLPAATQLARDVLVELHGDDRVARLEELNDAELGATVTWLSDRVAHLARL